MMNYQGAGSSGSGSWVAARGEGPVSAAKGLVASRAAFGRRKEWTKRKGGKKKEAVKRRSLDRRGLGASMRQREPG